MRRCARITAATFLSIPILFLFGVSRVWAQTTPTGTPESSSQPSDPKAPISSGIENPNVPQPGPTPEDRRVFGVLPNYRTASGQAPFVPLTVKQKFYIATKDSFDYPVYFTTAFFAGISQIKGKENETYGQGAVGYFHRYGIAYADQVVGNYFPEAIVPSIVHEDPRYYRKGEGSFKSRLFYSVTRILVCKNDNGEWTFNVPEIVGNTLAAATTLSYHVHERTAGDAAEQFSTYIEADIAGQILKEFWPDVKSWYKRRHQASSQQIAQP